MCASNDQNVSDWVKKARERDRCNAIRHSLRMGNLNMKFRRHELSPDHLIDQYESMTNELKRLLCENLPYGCAAVKMLRMDQHRSSNMLCWHFRFLEHSTEYTLNDEIEFILSETQWVTLLASLKTKRPLLEYELVHNQLDGIDDLCIRVPKPSVFKHRAQSYVNASLRWRILLLNTTILTLFGMLLFLAIRSDQELNDTYRAVEHPVLQTSHEEL